MTFLRSIEVEGLFGLYNHRLDFREAPPLTIVAGPNGVGKTTLLRLTTALLRGEYRDLAKHQFVRLTIINTDDSCVEAVRIPEERPDSTLHTFVLRQLRETTVEYEHTIAVQPIQDVVPSYIAELEGDRFIDVRDGEQLSGMELRARYGAPEEIFTPSVPDWFDKDAWKVDFIETKRLDTLIGATPAPYRLHQPWRPPSAPIDRYLGVVADTLEESRRDSARIYQSRTRSVARRLLGEYGRKTVNAERLRERYARVEERAAVLTKNGLLLDSLDQLPDEDLNPTLKRFFELFLDDFEAKLEPLEPVSAKLDQLRSIISRKFINKELAVDPEMGIIFEVEPDGRPIAADGLSSGEQHQLALISRLLFSEEAGTTILIDEPELSLHVGWQHAMVDDLRDIGEVTGVAFVLATHSTAIINGRWDLVENLGSIESPA